MASDDLYENIRLIGIGAGHVVTAADEFLAEITELARQGFTFASGGGSSSAETDLLAAFTAGRGGQLF
jgi:hypothetical protein